MEIDSDNNLERFKTGSGATEAEEIHDFQIEITGIRFFGRDKCHIKSQIKGNLPRMGGHNKERLMTDLTDELMPVKPDEEHLIWVAAEQSLKDTGVLSNKILDLRGLSIYLLQLEYPKDGERKKRGVHRAKRQLNTEEFEAAAEERDLVSHTEDDISRVEEGEEEQRRRRRGGGGVQSAAGSAFNPENPYHRCRGAREDGALTFDVMLDPGICCSECRRSYTHVSESLHGYWPWPYNCRGFQVAYRVIVPCPWWVGHIFGVA
ncbi:LOW QUALITY PROTEIN: leukocyte cell-derived chemotaxin 1 [Pholidichthys leucotaenia]